MDLSAALLLSAHLIESGETHIDYEHTVKLADTYKIFITGSHIERLLFQFTQRESAELFAQRVALTKSITPAVASSIQKPFFKVARNNRVRKNIEVSNPTKLAIINEMVTKFYGKKNSKNRGLDYWLKTKFPRISFTDPNAWAVVEWDAPQSESEIIQVRPFILSAAQAVNFLVENDETKWLFGRQAINFLQFAEPGNNIRTKKAPGFRFTLYDQDWTLVYEQVDKDYITRSGYVFSDNELLVEINKNTFIQRTYEPKLGHVPAERIGYVPDGDTNDRTFVNPFHEALTFFYKSLKTVSEFDLTMCLHAFPQKFQYVYKCQGESKELKCESGRVRATGAECQSCKGTGFKIHTTAQDALLVPMPEEGTLNQELWDLSKFVHYESPPIDLIKFQNDYIQQLKGESHEAVFNSQVFVKKAGGGNTQAQGDTFAPTATAEDNRMESVYDTLEPYTEKLSEVYKTFVTYFAILAGEKEDNVSVTHVFPANPKLKTPEQLINEIAAANASGAPSFMRDNLTYELAENVLQGDELNFLKYQVKDRFFPFSGKSPDEIAMLLASQFVSTFNKVFYANFDSIFMDVELENPGFYLLKSQQEQTNIVKEMVKRYMDEINQEAPTLSIETLRGAIGRTPPGSGSPGADDTDTATDDVTETAQA
jgi:hypothetical protein